MTLIATCPRCAAPLVTTFQWNRYEFYCLDCGGHYGWLDPAGVEETPARVERMEAYEAEWRACAVALIPSSGWLRDCPDCKGLERGNEHWRHATPEARIAHDQAIESIHNRVKPKYRQKVVTP